MNTNDYFLIKKGVQVKNPMYESHWIGNETKNFRRKDNDKCYISSGAMCYSKSRIRVPKLRASNRV